MSIRVARAEDMGPIMGLLRLRHAECARFANVPFQAVVTHARVGAMISGAGLVAVVEDGKIVASIGLCLSQFWDSRDRHIEDLWNFVHPAHRRTSHAKDLATFAKGVSDRMRLPLVLSEIDNDVNSPKLRLLERSMEHMGVIFRHIPIAHA